MAGRCLCVRRDRAGTAGSGRGDSSYAQRTWIMESSSRIVIMRTDTRERIIFSFDRPT
jgi:hypothetical protein